MPAKNLKLKVIKGKSVKSLNQDDVVRTLLESISEGVIIIDQKGKIVFVNQRFTEIFGYRKSEIIRKNLDLLIPRSEKERHASHIESYFERPVIRPMGTGLELRGKHKNGRKIPLEVSLSFLKFKEGNFGMAFVTDITTRKKAEDELRERNEELDSFAHMVAHDLNSTINNITGFSHLLLNDIELDENEKEAMLNRIITSSMKMSSIISELLLFANLKKDEVKFDPLEMGELIENVIDRLQPQIKERRAEIKIAKYFPKALGHDSWIEEVWYNLILNALKYGGDPPVIKIGGKRVKNKIQFWIEDNGQGLNEHQKELILLSPEKVKHPTIQGHGYGLSIVMKILKKLDGKLQVESKENKGTRFLFTLKKVPK